MPNFRFYEKGAPFPGTCVFSGETKNLWEIGSMTVQGQPLTVLLSDRVLQELAVHTGFITSRSYAEQVAVSQKRINELEAQNKATPELLRKFQNDFSNLVSEFVTSLGSVPVPDKPVQLESDPADAGESAAEPGSGAKSGKGKKQTSESSAQSTE